MRELWMRAAGAFFVFSLAVPVVADVPVERVLSASRTLPDGGTRFFSGLTGHPGSDHVQVLARVKNRARAVELGLSPKGEHFAVLTASQDELAELTRVDGIEEIFWTAPRHLQLDQVAGHIELPSAVEDFGVDGSGVTIGIIDTGIDIAHPSVMNEDGTTRIQWILSYGEPPLGNYPELEEEFECSEETPCAVYGAAEIDEALESGEIEGFFPDDIGHGTHITSIAAGSDPDHPGVAPGADLVVVQAAGETGSVSDARILAGTDFIFDRAAEAMQPAVVNVSLGSSFGAHDGTSAIEEALTQIAAGPGRAIVVASGNDGGLFGGLSEDYPEPIGSHTQVHIPRDSEVRVPIITPPAGTSEVTGSVFVWITTDPDEDVELSFHNGRGESTDPVGRGESGGLSAAELGDPDDYEFVIFNGVDEELDADVQPGSIVVLLGGTWESGRVFELVLEGEGPAKLWVEGGGGVSDMATGIGVVFPRGRSSGTVTVPASAPQLISVGASVNRNEWTDFTDTPVDLELGEVGTRAFFSGAGPNGIGHLKPDVLAPGGNVIAAMSRASDPREEDSERSQFVAQGTCGDVECFVVDDDHAVASGTSMATPVVSGAVALLFQRDPSLTMEEVRRLLRSGAADSGGVGANRGLSGAGVLDVVATLRALDMKESDAVREPASGETRMVFADGFLRPDAPHSLQGVALLRDEEGWPAAGFDESLLKLDIEGPAAGEIEVQEAGLARLSLTAEPASGLTSATVRLLFDGEPIDEMTLPIDVDSHATNFGPSLGGGTCSIGFAATPVPSRWSMWCLLLAAGMVLARRRTRMPLVLR